MTSLIRVGRSDEHSSIFYQENRGEQWHYRTPLPTCAVESEPNEYEYNSLTIKQVDGLNKTLKSKACFLFTGEQNKAKKRNEEDYNTSFRYNIISQRENKGRKG